MFSVDIDPLSFYAPNYSYSYWIYMFASSTLYDYIYIWLIYESFNLLDQLLLQLRNAIMQFLLLVLQLLYLSLQALLLLSALHLLFF